MYGVSNQFIKLLSIFKSRDSLTVVKYNQINNVPTYICQSDYVGPTHR